MTVDKERRKGQVRNRGRHHSSWENQETGWQAVERKRTSEEDEEEAR